MAPNTSVKLDILRKGSSKTVNVTLGELPKQREARLNKSDEDDQGSKIGKLGLTLAPGESSGSGGVVVAEVDPRGVAADHGFKSGDVILEVAGKSVSSPSDVRKAVADARTDGKRTVLMRVKSGENSRFVALPLDRA
jgi:serine protease Do